MRFIVFADLHLDAAFSRAGNHGDVRRQALRDTLLNIMNLADEVDADAILCAGDLYEQDRFTPDTREFLQQTFAGTERPIYIAPGNHDYYGPESLYRQAAWSANVHIFEEARFTPVALEAGVTLWGAAFLTPTRSEGFFESGFSVEGGGTHIALFHGSEKSGFLKEITDKSPYGEFDARDIELAGIDHAFVGHYHEPRDADRYTYPGNPDPLTFGETGDRGVVIADVLPDGTVKRQRRKVAVSSVHDLSVDVTGCSSFQEIRDRCVETLSGLTGMARLALNGELSTTVELKVQDLSNIENGLQSDPVVRIGNLSVAYQFDEIAEEPNVRGQFVRDVRDSSELDEEEKRRILVCGLRALEGRADLEVT